MIPRKKMLTKIITAWSSWWGKNTTKQTPLLEQRSWYTGHRENNAYHKWLTTEDHEDRIQSVRIWRQVKKKVAKVKNKQWNERYNSNSD